MNSIKMNILPPGKNDTYVYLIYFDADVMSHCKFIGKLGKGTYKRYKSYRTPYGPGYIACILYINEAYQYESIIRSKCREYGYIANDSETIQFTTLDNDTYIDIKNRYKRTIDGIINVMHYYGDLHRFTYDSIYIDMIPQFKMPVIKVPEIKIDPNEWKKRIKFDSWNKQVSTKSMDNIIYLHYMKYKNNVIGIIIYNTLSKMFKIGGYDLDECIQNKRNDIKLVYSTDDSTDMKECMNTLIHIYHMKKITQIWKLIHKFLLKNMLMLTRHMRTGKGGRDYKYTYTIDISEWIYHTLK